MKGSNGKETDTGGGFLTIKDCECKYALVDEFTGFQQRGWHELRYKRVHPFMSQSHPLTASCWFETAEEWGLGFLTWLICNFLWTKKWGRTQKLACWSMQNFQKTTPSFWMWPWPHLAPMHSCDNSLTHPDLIILHLFLYLDSPLIRLSMTKISSQILTRLIRTPVWMENSEFLLVCLKEDPLFWIFIQIFYYFSLRHIGN